MIALPQFDDQRRHTGQHVLIEWGYISEIAPIPQGCEVIMASGSRYFLPVTPAQANTKLRNHSRFKWERGQLTGSD